jgi:hypothetical protein
LSNVLSPAYGNTVIGKDGGNNLGVGGGNIQFNTLVGYRAALNLTGGSGNTWVGGYIGPSAVLNSTITLANNTGTTANAMLDYYVTTGYVWSFAATIGGAGTGLHVYNTMTAVGNPGNYERGVFSFREDFSGAPILTIGCQAGGTGTIRMTSITGFPKAGAPASGDLTSGTFSVIDDTTNNQTWLVFNKAGTIRKVQLT